jgi:hypothetical protein
VSWPDEVDEILGGDMTAAVAYVTPAGGAVVSAVAPVGMRDREAGTVTFTTSLGFGKKLERIEADPRVTLAYHARDHGFTDRPEYVVVQGLARREATMSDARRSALRAASTRFMGKPRTGFFWDRLLREYYMTRVPVDVEVERVVAWPDLRCEGEPEVLGEALPGPPSPQEASKKGTGPRIDVTKAAKRLGSVPHVLLSYVQEDGYPAVVPVEVAAHGSEGLGLWAAEGLIPSGGRRAGLLGHSYKPRLVGLVSRVHTGWLDGDRRLYAPHTAGGFKAPANKTLLLLANGLAAKRGVKKARREGKLPAAA